MHNTAVLDLFLGDSGKGKIVDYLAETAHAVVRFNGSNNAGHTLSIKGQQYKTHSIPSGILHPHTVNFIAHGCIMDPLVLSEEILKFSSFNSKIYISGQAHMILPHHIKLDCARELKKPVGSTKRGVAPAYESKMARYGLRYQDLLLPKQSFLNKAVEVFNNSLSSSSNIFIEELSAVFDKTSDTLSKHIITDSLQFIHNLADKGGIVFEGAQGTFLDIDVGDYPFVTSSNCTVGAILTGTGLNITHINEIVGVIKAYGSYVGTNTKFEDINDPHLNDLLCSLGQEFGATTGRRRRLCWLDLDQIHRAVLINGPTKLAITRLDTLGQMPQIKVKWENKFVSFEPWGDLSGVRSMNDLPSSCRQYLDLIVQALKRPIWAVGIGPDRDNLLREV